MSNEQPKEREMFSATGQIVALEPIDPLLADLLEGLEQEPSNEVHRVASEAEAHQVLMQAGICMVILSVLNKEQALNATRFLKKCEAQTHSKQARIVVVSSFNDPRMSDSFVKGGAAETIFRKVDRGLLQQKIKGHLKGQKVRKENQAHQQQSEAKAQEKKDKQALDQQASATESTASTQAATKHVQLSDKPEIGAPLEKAPDVFLIGSTRPRRVGVQWVLEVEGPDTITGSWSEIQIQIQDQKDKNAWLWKETGHSEQWHFIGNQPQYNPSTRKWRFVGSRPELHWIENGQVVESKISILPEGRFLLAMDSAETKSNLEANRARGKVIRDANKKKVEEEAKLAAAKSIADPTSDLPMSFEAEALEFKKALTTEEAKKNLRTKPKNSAAKTETEATPFRVKLRKRIHPDQTEARLAVDFLSQVCDAHLIMPNRAEFQEWLITATQSWLKASSVEWKTGSEPQIQREKPLSAVEQAVLARLKNVA